MKTKKTSSMLSLRGLTLAPSQSLGAIRLVPVLRDNAPGDLRLAKRAYSEDEMVVDLGGRSSYASYVPHAIVCSWSDDGTPVAAFGANMKSRDGKRYGSSVRLAHRMARREDVRRLRLLPLHLSMEGFLAQHFAGPDVAWSEYSRSALSRGLSPRTERSVSGRGIRGLEDALRVFEIHDAQVGVLVFVADALASVFIVSHPDDYRALHRTLLEDFYGELMMHYGKLGVSGRIEAQIDASTVSSLDDLAGAAGALRDEWGEFHREMAAGLLARSIRTENVYRCGEFQLARFGSSLQVGGENHLGESISRRDGTIEYLKTYRLSAAQTKRAYLLQRLAEHRWNLEATAASLGQPLDALVLRLENLGFGYLLKDQVLQSARRRSRR